MELHVMMKAGKPYNYSLDLTEGEAKALFTICSMVSGDNIYSPQKFTNRVLRNFAPFIKEKFKASGGINFDKFLYVRKQEAAFNERMEEAATLMAEAADISVETARRYLPKSKFDGSKGTSIGLVVESTPADDDSNDPTE